MVSNRLVLILLCIYRISDVVFAHLDINDILSVKLMPISWLMLDNNSKVSSSNKTEENRDNSTLNTAEPRHDGSFDIAYSTMGFHRY